MEWASYKMSTESSGPSIKKAQHAAAVIALDQTSLKHPTPKSQIKAMGPITPTIELNALAMKRGEPAVYQLIEPQRPLYLPNLNFRGMYNQRYHYPKIPTYCVSLKVGSKQFFGEGHTAQAARHAAAQEALNVLRNLPCPENVKRQTEITLPKTNGESPDEDGNESDDHKSPISLVHEIALKRSLTVNFEVTRESGPPHMRTFVTRCTVGYISTDGEGNGKKVSKKRAAEKMLDELKKLPSLLPAQQKVKKKPIIKKKNRNLIEKKNMELPKMSEKSATSDSDCSTSESKMTRRYGVHSPSENRSTPTAVVVPVVHDHDSSRTQQNKRKSKSDNLTDEINKKKKCEEASDKKNNSPLNKLDSSEDTVLPLDNTADDKKESSEESLDTSCTDSPKDIEMRDVSMDLIDDLTAKKETLFDTSACYYIVVDTNVLISELPLISELKDTPLDGCGPPHIFIPWVVIEELDKLKSQRTSKGSSRAGASEAIRYLNTVLSKHPRFHGQSPQEAEEWSKSYSKNNDDKILECCMALMDKMPPEKVILLTNDKNLVNKALICKINVHNFESMMKKVKPDTIFNYEELKNDKRRKRERERKLELDSISLSISQDKAEERQIRNARDTFKREIHSLMSNARFLLKDVLSKFLEKEMFEAYGSIWLEFPIEKKLLKGILEGIKKYWRSLFSEFFSEKERRNFELLQEKASRPEGYLGDKDDCLIILSTIEDVFRQIHKRRPTIRASVEEIKEYRIACLNAFTRYNEAENSARALEEKNILDLFNADWNAVNQLLGAILDHYNVSSNFNYVKLDGHLPQSEVNHILITLYPEVEKVKKLMVSMWDAVKSNKSSISCARKLASALLEFLPNLQVPYDPITYPFFNSKALERFFCNKQHRETIEIGIQQIEEFHEKLDEVLCSLLRGEIKTPKYETMACD